MRKEGTFDLFRRSLTALQLSEHTHLNWQWAIRGFKSAFLAGDVLLGGGEREEN